MANIFDYLKWRGDLSFAVAPFNEVDELIMSELSYIDFTDVVPADCSSKISLKDAADQLFAKNKEEKMSLGVIIPDDIVKMTKKLADCPRFRNIQLYYYVNHIIEESGKQFSALAADLGDGSTCVIYRGTDDTIVGWKESFSISFITPVPAQAEAVEYLHTVALSTYCPIRVMGHSKGGNLAVYAGAFVCPEVQARILSVFSGDGPGFGSDIRHTDGYVRIKSRIRSFVPQSSVVGMLLTHEDDYSVVKSRQKGIMQHDGFSWEVEGAKFVHLNDISESGHLVDETLKTWIGEMSNSQREKFVDALFSIFEATGCKTLTELNQAKYAGEMVKTLQHMDKESRDVINETFRMLFRASAKNIRLLSRSAAKNW